MLSLRTHGMDPHGLLPGAIYIMFGPRVFSIYRGTPLDMVLEMSHEMTPGLDPQDAINAILGGLARNRGIYIHLDAAPRTSDETVAALFILALLDQRVARPLATA